MNYKHVLNIGLNDKDSKKQEITTAAALERLYKIVFRYGLDGGTVTTSTGFYKHKNGETVTETTLNLEIVTFDKKDLKTVFSMARTIKRLYNQETILYNCTETTTRLF